MAKEQLPRITPGDSIYKVLSADYQGKIADGLRRFNQLPVGQSMRSTGTANFIPPRTEGPEKVVTGKLLGDVGPGTDAKYGYETGVIEVQVFDYDEGRPDDQDDERRFEIVDYDVSLNVITITGLHASKFPKRHELWLRDSEDNNGSTRDGTYSVNVATDVIASSVTEIEVYETIPSIIDPATSEELVKGKLWLWSSYELTETVDYRMVVNRSSSSFSKDDLVEVFWVDDEYLMFGAKSPPSNTMQVGMALDNIGGQYSYTESFTDPETNVTSNVRYYEAGVGRVKPFKLDENQTYPDRDIFKYDISDLVDGSATNGQIIISGNVINHFGSNFDLTAFPEIPGHTVTAIDSSSLTGKYEVLKAEYNSSNNTTEITTAEAIGAAIVDGNRVIDGQIVMPGWSRMQEDSTSVYVVNRSNRAIRTGTIVHYMHDGHEYRILAVEC